MSLAALVKAKKAFFIPVLIFIITGIVFLSLYSKATIHLTQNAWYSQSSDLFFKYLTLAGDGWVYAAVVPLFLFFPRRYFIGLIFSALLTLFLSAGLKSYFKEMERPVKYFEGKHQLHLVEGVHNHSFKSFPSGHTTTAFACWGFIALMLRSATWQFGLAILSLLIGYSRIAISQHFLMDVVAGTVLGTIIASISLMLCLKINKSWADKVLVNVKHKN